MPWIRLTVACLMILLTAALSGTATAYDADLPFQAGEKLTYQAKWGFIPAGKVVMEVHPSRSEEGTTLHHFTMSASTSSQIDALYPIRDVQHSFTDLALTRTLHYAKHTTGKKIRDSKITFDWGTMTAVYSNDGLAEKTVSILPGTLDPLALIYALRLKELKPGSVVEIPVTNGKGFNLVRGVVTGRETLAIEGKSYDTFVIEPDLNSLNGLMEKKPRMKIWLSVDKDRIPVKLQTRHTFGSLTFELVSNSKPRNN